MHVPDDEKQSCKEGAAPPAVNGGISVEKSDGGTKNEGGEKGPSFEEYMWMAEQDLEEEDELDKQEREFLEKCFSELYDEEEEEVWYPPNDAGSNDPHGTAVWQQFNQMRINPQQQPTTGQGQAYQGQRQRQGGQRRPPRNSSEGSEDFLNSVVNHCLDASRHEVGPGGSIAQQPNSQSSTLNPNAAEFVPSWLK